MRLFISILVISLPLYSIGIFVSQKYVSASHILAAILLPMLIMNLRESALFKSDVSWAKPFLLFLFFSFIGLAFSPYAPGPYFKGVLQIVGIFTMICMAIAINKYVGYRPERLLQIIKLLSITLGLFALVGIVQFIMLNLTPFSSSFSFNFLNNISGGTVWRDPGYLGVIHRSNSLAAEPTHFGRYLCLGLGLAFIRLGVLGQRLKRRLQNIVPAWVAASIVVGVIISFSINAWIMALFVMASLFIVSREFSVNAVLKMSLLSMSLIVVFLLASSPTEGGLGYKLYTISLIFSSTDIDTFEGSQISALAIASNISVALSNFSNSPIFGGGIGSHSFAYDEYAPWYVSGFDSFSALDGLNSEDAASLLFRLISETGVVGTLLFVAGLFSIIVTARKYILKKIAANDVSEVLAITIGLTASGIGLFELYLTRTGHYYDPMFWFMLAIIVSATRNLPREKA